MLLYLHITCVHPNVSSVLGNFAINPRFQMQGVTQEVLIPVGEAAMRK